MKPMLQNFLIVFSIIISNYCVKECLKPTINGCLALWKILLLMITGQKLILTNTKVLLLFKRPGSSGCLPASITSQNKPHCPVKTGLSYSLDFYLICSGFILPLFE